MRINALAIALAAVGLVLAAACGDDPPSGRNNFVEDAGTPDRGRDIPDVQAEEEPPPPCLPALEAIDGTDLAMPAGTELDLTAFLHTCEDEPIADTTVEFALQGDAADTQLVSRTAFTDVNGLATVVLRAGPTTADFEVVATVVDVAPLVFTISVEPSPSGIVEVSIEVPEAPAFDAFDALLFEDADCADLGPYDRGDAFLTAPTVATTASRPTFTEVPVGTGYAVVVLADFDGGLLGYGCTDEVSVAGAQKTTVTVVIGEIPVLYHGVYDLANRFDFSDALPPSVATTLQVLGEIADDDDLDGNAATEDFGLDPAAFVLDFVYREFCCWEATGADPDFDSCLAQAFQHPYGDLSALYLHDFTSWDGAQPSSPFLCGGLTFANEFVQQELQNLIVENVPGIVLNLLQMISDLARAVTDAHIGSELTVSDASLTKTGNFTHRLVDMTVELHDLDGDLHTFVFDLLDAGLTNLSYSDETTVETGHRLVIPEHAFRMDFGRLLFHIYQNGLLPLLDCDPDGDGTTEPCENTGDLLATWVDCQAVGIWLYDAIGLPFPTEATYEAFCETGVTVAGFVIDGQIQATVEAETVISLQGGCAAGALDDRRRATQLVDGLWTGVLSEDEVEIGPFDGTFEGLRTGDPE